jgi:hypothetical protein
VEVCPFISAKTNSPSSVVRARARGSPSMGAGSWVQGRRTATFTSTLPSQGHRRSQGGWIFKAICGGIEAPRAWPSKSYRARRSQDSQPREQAHWLI